jgi:hypothetical protein
MEDGKCVEDGKYKKCVVPVKMLKWQQAWKFRFSVFEITKWKLIDSVSTKQHAIYPLCRSVYPPTEDVFRIQFLAAWIPNFPAQLTSRS